MGLHGDGLGNAGCVQAVGLASAGLGLWVLLFSGLGSLMLNARDSDHPGHPDYTPAAVGALVGAALLVVGAVAVAYSLLRLGGLREDR